MTNAVQGSTSLLSALGAEDIPGLTLTRTIGHLMMTPVNPGAVNGGQRVTYGIGVVQSEALAAGAIADPDAATDFPLRGWVYRDMEFILDSVDSYDHPALHVRFDIKSQRKLHTQDSELMLVHESTNAFGTGFNARLDGWIRCLFKQP